MPDDNAIETLSPPVVEPGTSTGGYDAGYRAELDETEVIQRFAPTVKRLAVHLKGKLPETIQVEDLVQAGFIAVLRIARHAASLQSADASLRRSIRNAMIDEARRETWAPIRTTRAAKAAGAAMRAIRQRTGQDGSDEEIAAELGLSLSQYHQLLIDVAGIRLLNLGEFTEDGEQALQVNDSQEERLHQSRVTAALAESIAALPEREKLVISLYYEHELNMEEVGEVLGLNKSTICRTHGRALLMLRNALVDRSVATDPLSPRRGA